MARGQFILIEGHEKYINPDLSLEEIENEYKQQLNQKTSSGLKGVFRKTICLIMDQ